jgi:phosphotransferase system enzyme I (PtsI)
MDDAYLAARLDDIREVGGRLIGNLTRTHRKSPSRMPRGSIVVAQEMTPADTALLDPARVTGITAEMGGAEGHTAIMARSLGVAAVLAVPELLKSAGAGDSMVIDGDAGQIVVNPSPATLAAYQRRRDERQREKRQLARLRRQPAVTLDGTEITLQANVELPIEMGLVNQAGAAGIGLLRSEFMFMNRGDLPGEEEQFQTLRAMVEPMEGKPVTIRTLDVGGEKISSAVMGDFRESASSALGMRGIRLSLARDDLLETQFRACLRVSAFGNVRILMPMVTTASEMRQARAILIRAARRLKRRKVAMSDTLPPLGVMIEVPGAALAADALAQTSDFFAIGSNDLTMYTLAIDRGDDQVAYLYNPLHPAVLRLIQFATASALRARLPVSICGEIAGDPRYTALLLGLGLRELSMTPSNIPRVKKRILALDSIAATGRAGVIMDQLDAGRIAMLLDDFNALA